MGGAQCSFGVPPACLKRSLIFPYATVSLSRWAEAAGCNVKRCSKYGIHHRRTNPTSEKISSATRQTDIVELPEPLLPNFKHIWTETLANFITDNSCSLRWMSPMPVQRPRAGMATSHLTTDGKRKVAVMVSTWDTQGMQSNLKQH